VNKRQIIDDALYVHFVTFGTDKRRKLLDMDEPKKFLLDVLNHQLDSFSAKCSGFVIMPEHVHALLWFPETNQLSRFMHGWKRMSSFHIRKWYRKQELSYYDDLEQGNRFWTPKYYSFEIESDRKLTEKLDYIHLNPVRRGLVDKASDWKWSSADWYAHQREVGVPISWIE
jgi:putative transposase